MKKNLNIVYLNGAEGMIRRGGASSGDNGGDGSGSNNEVKWEYYKIDRPAFESSNVGMEIWYNVFAFCESSFRQNVDESGQYITAIGPFNGGEGDDYYKIALSDMPKYYDYNGKENFIDTKSPLENFARAIINFWYPADVEFILGELNSFLIPITKEEYITIDHLATYKSE